MRRRIAALASLALVLGGISVPVAAYADTMTLNQLEAQLTVSSPNLMGYDRTLFGDWTYTTGDGCNTRANLLKSQTLVPVTYSSDCTVATGQWLSWYDDLTWTQGSDVQIDHLVPLGEAWASGAENWTSAQLSAFANDTDGTELQIVTSSVNESKGDQDPTVWMPPAASAECRYITDWVLTKYRWSLNVDTSEQSAITGYLANNGCGDQTVTVPTVMIAPTVPTTSVTLPTVSTTTPCDSATGNISYTGGSGVTTVIETASDYTPVADATALAPGNYYADAAVNDGETLHEADLPSGWTAGDGEGDLVFHALLAITVAASTPCSTPAPASVPVYRFYNPNNGTHFFTMDVNERNSLWLNSGLSYESVAYAAFSSQVAGSVPLYRFFFPLVSDHFYTTSAAERDSIIAHFPASSSSYEGIAYYIYPVTPAVADTVTVARFYSPDSGTHFFTANAAERDHIIQTFPSHSLTYEGNEFRVPSVIPADTIPLPPRPVTPPPVVTPPPTVPGNPGDTKNCSDFSTYAAAKAWFDTYYPYYGDVARLDQDNDLIPCESLPGHP